MGDRYKSIRKLLTDREHADESDYPTDKENDDIMTRDLAGKMEKNELPNTTDRGMPTEPQDDETWDSSGRMKAGVIKHGDIKKFYNKIKKSNPA